MVFYDFKRNGIREDTIFCNDRTINQLNGWSETGSLSNSLYFNASSDQYYLKCPNKRDSFTVSDTEKGNSALTYPVGLLTTAEHSLIGNHTANKTNATYWSSAPGSFNYYYASERSVYSTGRWYNVNGVYDSGSVRPSLSLRPGTNFASGTGTTEDPYIVG